MRNRRWLISSESPSRRGRRQLRSRSPGCWRKGLGSCPSLAPPSCIILKRIEIREICSGRRRHDLAKDLGTGTKQSHHQLIQFPPSTLNVCATM
jgi:hypothetical protein